MLAKAAAPACVAGVLAAATTAATYGVSRFALANAFQVQQPPAVAQSWVWLAVWPCLTVGIAMLVVRRRGR
jgi:hypothetical protein